MPISKKPPAKKQKSTKVDYFYRAKILQRKAYREARSTNATSMSIVSVKIKDKSYSALNLLDTARWAAKYWAQEYTRPTWRYYRSSINYCAELMYEKSLIDIKTLYDIKDAMSEQPRYVKRSNKTSSQKQKKISDEEFKLLSEAIRSTKSKYAKPLLHWLFCNIQVGLRPCEWKECDVVTYRGKASLRVKNAKSTNGRSHGEYRYIDLSHLKKHHANTIQAFSAYCQKLEGQREFEATYQGCRRLLHRLTRKLWSNRRKHISLYSSRHQFSADLKYNGSRLEEIAYLMGHATTDTATFHYGKKRHGKSKVVPEVNPQDSVRVKQTYKPFSFEKVPLHSPRPTPE
ncbi:hypothetical protein [Vibrio alginolyticus]|uniref:hypothetical protein n=1 Tax=Vibrio alginolyticus TaxID=663 RepID=UPI0006CA9D09|nr:hypothetical protein [Vibrio alginolyticus]KPM98492.1 hypothetical protein AOG25_08590 [Vibrio alginolyticus]